MRNRLDLILRITCYALAALLAWQLVRVVLRVNPLARATVPELPFLASPSRPGSNGTNINQNVPPPGQGSNPIASSPGSNPAVLTAARTTNPVAPEISTGSNLPSALVHSISTGINSNALALTNGPIAATQTPSLTGTSSLPVGLLHVLPGGAANSGSHSGVGSPVGGSAELARAMAQQPPAPLAPGIQARVNWITESEILGSVMHPQPMALLGIAGNFAFLRASNGQTGMVKEGDQLSGLKLLRIGVNRVLVEENGEKKELTIFSGYGGESLIPEHDTHP